MEYKRVLDDWITSFLELTKDSEAPSLFLEWAALFAISSVTQRKVYAAKGHIKLYMNLWVLLLAPPGTCRKGDAIKFVEMMLDPLRYDAETSQGSVHIGFESLTREALLEQFELAKQCSIHNAVLEGAMPRNIEDIATTPLTVLSREFGSFISRKDEQFFNDMCDLFDSPPDWSYSTKKSGKVFLKNVFISILGATQPSALAAVWPKYATEGGFLPRFILVCGTKPRKRVSFMEIPELDNDLLLALQQDLALIHVERGRARFTDAAMETYTNWYNSIDELPPPGDDPRLRHYCARRPIHVIKLACLKCLSRGAFPEVDKQDITYALDLLERTEEMMPFGIVDAGVGQLLSKKQLIIDLLKQSPMRFGDLEMLLSDFLTLTQLRNLLKALYDRRVIKVNPIVFISHDINDIRGKMVKLAGRD